MKHDDMTSGYPISIDYHRLTNYQRDPRNKGMTCVSYPPSEYTTNSFVVFHPCDSFSKGLMHSRGLPRLSNQLRRVSPM